MSTFETILHPAMDLSYMRQLGNTRTRLVQVNPESGSTFTLSGTGIQDIFFSLPSGGGSATMCNGMNSYLCFDIAFVSTGSVGFSNADANSIIRSLEITSNGKTIEQLESYNVMSNIFSDFKSVDKARNLDSIMMGGTIQSASSSKQPREFANGGKLRVAVPIYSSFYGVLSQGQYAPVTNGGTRFRFQLEAPNTALVSTDGGTLGYTISNCSLKMEYVDIDEKVFAQLVSDGNGTLKTHGIGVVSTQTTLASGTTANTILIPVRKSAVKHIWNCVRPTANITASNRNSTGGRLNPNCRTIQWSINGKTFPPLAIRNTDSAGTTFAGAEVMAELLKTMRNLHANSGDVVFDAVMFEDNLADAESASFVFGYNWDTDMDSQSISGVDSLGSAIYLDLVSNATGVPMASTINSFVFYDSIMVYDVASGDVSVVQ